MMHEIQVTLGVMHEIQYVAWNANDKRLNACQTTWFAPPINRGPCSRSKREKRALLNKGLGKLANHI